jgi:hypothetical protein
MTERRVIRTSQDSVNGQTIRGNTHAASISGPFQPNQR